jgi:acetylornithine deacetylase/succinyl-diaminopimelate desuccinylase-like protein
VDFIDAHQGEIVSSLCELVRIPSISGSAAENLIQAHLAGQLADMGLEQPLKPSRIFR